MQYDFKNTFDKDKARAYLEQLIERHSQCEVKVLRKTRSRKQNAYWWSLLTYVAIETGYTLNEAETVVKRALGMTYEKGGRMFLKQTRTLNTEEMSVLTTRLLDWAAKDLEIYLHSPDEYEKNWQQIDEYVRRNRKNL